MIAVNTPLGDGTGSGPVEPSTPPVHPGEWVGHGDVPEVTATLVARPDDPVTPDRLLRRLEVLRQRLSVRWCGSSGVFAGYDRLEVAHLAAVTTGTIQFTARLVDAGHRSHTVELSATRTPAHGHQAGDAGPQVLVCGRGKSLEVTAEPS
jgi:hypothetical protein